MADCSGVADALSECFGGRATALLPVLEMLPLEDLPRPFLVEDVDDAASLDCFLCIFQTIGGDGSRQRKKAVMCSTEYRWRRFGYVYTYKM